MPIHRRFIDSDVLTEARQRIRYVMASFDSWCVAFSGGKDSIVVLHLVRQAMDAAGLQDQPLEVVFRDEELISDVVVNTVRFYFDQPERYALRWYAVPLMSEKFILGRKYEYVQWDPARPHVRDKPAWAITEPTGRVFDQYSMDDFATRDMAGRVAVFNGTRASESLTRRFSCLNKLDDNYINATEVGRVKMVKPIYDWEEVDVFRFIHDEDIPYCPIYDAQLWNGEALRVSTPLHAETAKNLGRLRTLDPAFYDRILSVFPEMEVQDRYWNDIDRNVVFAQYGVSWRAMISWIKDNIPDPALRALAAKRVQTCRSIRRNNLRKGVSKDTYGGYPLLYVFKQIIGGNYKRVILPLRAAKVSKEMRRWEDD